MNVLLTQITEISKKLGVEMARVPAKRGGASGEDSAKKPERKKSKSPKSPESLNHGNHPNWVKDLLMLRFLESQLTLGQVHMLETLGGRFGPFNCF